MEFHIEPSPKSWINMTSRIFGIRSPKTIGIGRMMTMMSVGTCSVSVAMYNAASFTCLH